jgi:hypothetical protein
LSSPSRPVQLKSGIRFFIERKAIRFLTLRDSGGIAFSIVFNFQQFYAFVAARQGCFSRPFIHPPNSEREPNSKGDFAALPAAPRPTTTPSPLRCVTQDAL